MQDERTPSSTSEGLLQYTNASADWVGDPVQWQGYAGPPSMDSPVQHKQGAVITKFSTKMFLCQHAS